MTYEQMIEIFEYRDDMSAMFSEMAKEYPKDEEEKGKYIQMLLQCVYIKFLILYGPRKLNMPSQIYLLEIISECQKLCSKILIANQKRVEEFKKLERGLQQDYAEIEKLIENNFAQFEVVYSRLKKRQKEHEEAIKELENFMTKLEKE